MMLLLACHSPLDTGAETDDTQDTGVEEVWEHLIEVGEGYDYTHPNEVPWEALEPSTHVLIHEGTYQAKWVIDGVGPIKVEGVGTVIIDGEGAQTRQALDYWNEDRSVIKIGGGGLTEVASDITVENLKVRGGQRDHGFTDDAGQAGVYADNAACIHVEAATGVRLVGNELSDCGNGLFVSPLSGEVLVRGNFLHHNGVPGSAYEHNSYTEAASIVFEFNRYGPLRAEADGNNLKDRSGSTTIRYNWIDAGNRQLDLVESETFEQDAPAWVYGNVLLEPDGAGNSQIVHYGGDNGDTSHYRTGTLHFFHNTVVSTRSGDTTLVRLSTSTTPFEARSNVVVAGSLAVSAGAGQVDLVDNALPEGWRETFEAQHEGSFTDAGTLTQDPMLDAEARPQAASPLLGAAGDLASGAPEVDQEYVRHQRAGERSARTTIGAFEGP